MSEKMQKDAAVNALEARLQAMRKDIVLAEERVLRYGCAATNETFLVTFRRKDVGGRFRIETVTKDSGEAGAFGGLFKKSAPPAARQTYNWDEFDTRGFRCPGCGDHKGLYNCSCLRLMCAANEHLVGNQKRFACHPACGESFFGTPAPQVTGEMGSKMRALPVPEKKRALEAPRLRLTGPAK